MGAAGRSPVLLRLSSSSLGSTKTDSGAQRTASETGVPGNGDRSHREWGLEWRRDPLSDITSSDEGLGEMLDELEDQKPDLKQAASEVSDEEHALLSVKYPFRMLLAVVRMRLISVFSL